MLALSKPRGGGGVGGFPVQPSGDGEILFARLLDFAAREQQVALQQLFQPSFVAGQVAAGNAGEQFLRVVKIDRTNE